MMVNDAYDAAEGRLAVTLEREGGEKLSHQEVPFHVPGLGQQTYVIELQVPQTAGTSILKAAAYANGQAEPTVSRRKVAIQASAH